MIDVMAFCYTGPKLKFTCDNQVLGVYANGRRLKVKAAKGSLGNWGKTKSVILPKRIKTIGIHCIDKGVIAGILASSSNGLITNGKWECTRRVTRK